jgi:hypothetical protein
VSEKCTVTVARLKCPEMKPNNYLST